MRGAGVSVAVVGAQGRMGRLFMRILAEAGCRTAGFDPASGPFTWEEVADCDVALIATPAPAFAQVMAAIGPHTRRSGAVVDVCSLKQGPLAAMKTHCRGAVVATHPLFGPYLESLAGHTLFVCHGQDCAWGVWFIGIMETLGVKIVFMEAEEHDRLMAVIQSLRHLLAACLGDALRKVGFDERRVPPEVAGPWFGRLREILANQAEQDGGLYADLALGNATVGKVFNHFAESVQEASGLLTASDRDALARFCNRAASRDPLC